MCIFLSLTVILLSLLVRSFKVSVLCFEQPALLVIVDSVTLLQLLA